MDKLYAPWRDKYLLVDGEKPKDDLQCVFCNVNKKQSLKNSYILGSYKHVAVLLNLYPYNAGHLLIVPHQHAAHLHTLTREQRADMMELATLSADVLQKHLGAAGINIGFNLGAFAGGSIPDHVHMHVVPRWNGDTGFMPVIGHTKIVSIDLQRVYHDLLPYFKNLSFE